MKACAYIRVSTDDQNTAIQVSEIKRYCEFHNLEVDIFEEKVSGAKRSRPKLDLMLDLIVDGRYDRLIVYKLDRFSRSLTDLISMLGLVQNAGCAFISLKESLDFSTAVGRMQVQLLAVFSEFEASLIRERTKAGLAAARLRGVLPGAKPRSFSLSRYQKLKADGWRSGEIAELMGFSRSQLFSRLGGLRKV